MASLELQARLDTLLSTAQAETADIDLFAPVMEKEECPICLIPLPHRESEITFHICCGKRVCEGCIYKNRITEAKNGVPDSKHKCAFCRQPPPKNVIKALRKLMKKNNPDAFLRMADRYESGNGVIQSDTRVLEMYTRAAELGSARAYGNIGIYYQDREQDFSKAFAFYEVGAKKGCLISHAQRARALALHYGPNGSKVHEIVRHLKVLACSGDEDAIDGYKEEYKNKKVSKEDLTQTLRAYQASYDAVKSKDRDNARDIKTAMDAKSRGEISQAKLKRLFDSMYL